MTRAPQAISMFCIPKEHKAVPTLEYFITHVKFRLSYFDEKALR